MTRQLKISVLLVLLSARANVRAQEKVEEQVVAMLQRKSGATPRRDYGQDGMAKAHRPRLHGGRDEEGRVRRRVLQIRQRRAHLVKLEIDQNDQRGTRKDGAPDHLRSDFEYVRN
jgi:hypothetical protein